MIKSIEFINFRNLDIKYVFGNNFNIVVGSNNSGKTNLLDGIRLAFSCLDGSYFKIEKSDFRDSDDGTPFEIKIELDYNSIPSFNYEEDTGIKKCGFWVTVRKTSSDRYVRDLLQLDGVEINRDILLSDPKIPNVHAMPLYRVEDIYSPGLKVGLAHFLNSQEKYKEIRDASKDAIKKDISTKRDRFMALVSKFTTNMDIDITNPSISAEKLFIVDGDKEHNLKIGSGYKSIANIFLSTLDDKYNILLIDEIENHLHPSLIRTLVNELKKTSDAFIIATTHSPVVINEMQIESLIDTGVGTLQDIDKVNRVKLNTFLHPGRAELILCEKVILVEGFSEELLLRNYVVSNGKNWTIVNVGGVMFEPYIKLAKKLNKRVIVISDDDRSEDPNGSATQRFKNLEILCTQEQVRMVRVFNTLETDLFNCGLLVDMDGKLTIKTYNTVEYKVAKSHQKTAIAQALIENDTDLSNWHVIQDVVSEFESN